MHEVLDAAILVGGRARRLGGQFKPLLDVGGRSILTRQIEALQRAGVQSIAMIGAWPAEEQPPLPIFADAVEGQGGLGALYTALLVATGDATIVIAGDMPFVGPALIRGLLAALERQDQAVVAKTADGIHPLCGAYRRSCALVFKARVDRGQLGIQDALADLRVRELGPPDMARFDPDDTMLMNVNTPADYERARRAALSCA